MELEHTLERPGYGRGRPPDVELLHGWAELDVDRVKVLPRCRQVDTLAWGDREEVEDFEPVVDVADQRGAASSRAAEEPFGDKRREGGRTQGIDRISPELEHAGSGLRRGLRTGCDRADGTSHHAQGGPAARSSSISRPPSG